MDKVVLTRELDGAPSEFQIFPYGEVDVEGDPPALCDEESMSLIIETFDRRGNDMVVDYEHQTLKDVQAPAAGWIKKLISRGKQGLWALVDWTAIASQFLKNREYRYFSPVFNVRKSDRKIVGLFNVALTNFPRLNNLRPIIAKQAFCMPFDPVTLEVGKIMGNTREDLIRYGTRNEYQGQRDQNDVILKAAELLGNTMEEINKYGVNKNT